MGHTKDTRKKFLSRSTRITRTRKNILLRNLKKKGTTETATVADGKSTHPSSVDVNSISSQEQINNTQVSDETAADDNDSYRIEKIDSSVNVGNYTSTNSNERVIVNVQFLFNEIHRVFDNHSKGIECLFKDWKLTKTRSKGLMTQLFFKCDMCHYETSIWSEPRNEFDTIDINRAAVTGTITSGIGFYQFQELLAAMSISSMCEKRYINYREDIVDVFVKTSVKNMKSAGEEERKLALERGDVINGVPYITVVVDGSWAKRSYGTNYDSLSGVGAIVGYYTRKVLFVGIRNKFCAICDTKRQSMQYPRQHVCYKNFDRAANSASMEADAIVEGFKSSIEMHGLIYKSFIADGDSNVYKSIRDNDPYRQQMIQVQKIECTNHLLRNLCKKLRAVGESTQQKGKRARGFYEIRAVVKRNIFPIRTAIMDCVTSRRCQTDSQHVQEAELQRDILNLLNHTFGQHVRCEGRSYAHTCNETNKENIVPYLKLHGFYDKLESAIRYLSAHSASLILNVTNNDAESFNSIICKTIGGKRINFGGRGSYNARVSSAVLQFNEQQVLTDLFKFSNKKVPSAVENMEKRRRQKIIQTRMNRAATVKSKLYDKSTSTHTNKYYGLHSQKPDVSSDAFDRLVESHFEKLSENSKNWQEIEHITRDQVNSELWVAIRKQMLTASNFGMVCRMRITTSCAAAVKKILYPPSLDAPALQFGRDNEETARKELEKKINKKIAVCGLFVDREIPFLGASPDGLIDNDGLVEIKCPFSAEKLTAEDAINTIPHLRNIFDAKVKNSMNKKHPHFYQVQGQLHIAQRDYCMYTIWTPKSIVTLRVSRDDTFWEHEMKDRLVRFYEECLLPEIVDSRYLRNMPIRDPPYILHAKENARIRKEKVINGERWNSEAAEETKTVQKNITGNAGSRATSFLEVADNDDCVVVDCLGYDPSKHRQLIDNAIAPLHSVIDNVSAIDGKLNDESLDMFLRIVRETSDFETQSVLYVVYPSLIQTSNSCKSLQIIGGNSCDHWRCVFFDGQKLYVYDSLPACTYEKLSNEEKKYIALRYPTIRKCDMVFPSVQTQPDCWSCGIYAAAFATTLVYGKDPSKAKYSTDVALMRSHFVQIMQSRKLSHFPQ